jgi:hypothetical protein
MINKHVYNKATFKPGKYGSFNGVSLDFMADMRKGWTPPKPKAFVPTAEMVTLGLVEYVLDGKTIVGKRGKRGES